MEKQRHCSVLLLAVAVVFVFLVCPTRQEQRKKKLSIADLAALTEIKNSLIDVPWSGGTAAFFSTWNFTSSSDPCSSFAGITCSEDFDSGNIFRVTSLTLGTGFSDSPGLAGTLSPFLSNLTELTQLILFAGIVTGPIPVQLGNLKFLRVISLTGNRLTGPIPATIADLPQLHTLDLSHNQLAGTIPPGLAGLAQLRVLILASNRLSGELPEKLPAHLLHLDIKNNGLSGTLPDSLPPTLRYLAASQNQMWGLLNGLESLSQLVYLDLSMNRFSGPIPPSLFRPTLSSILLQRNNLSGGLHLPPPPPSTNIYGGAGTIVDLSHNFLTGKSPAALAGIESLFLNNNRLSGTVPKEYVDSMIAGRSKTLYLQHNYISGIPWTTGMSVPGSVSMCLSYNCMIPPVGLRACPASAGEQLSRPTNQCSAFNHGSSSTD